MYQTIHILVITHIVLYTIFIPILLLIDDCNLCYVFYNKNSLNILVHVFMRKMHLV